MGRWPGADAGVKNKVMLNIVVAVLLDEVSRAWRVALGAWRESFGAARLLLPAEAYLCIAFARQAYSPKPALCSAQAKAGSHAAQATSRAPPPPIGLLRSPTVPI